MSNEEKKLWLAPRFLKSPAMILVAAFAAVIVLGGLVLWLPVSAAAGKTISFLDALFTSTSAVCVTGLTVIDTATMYSTFGQVAIMILIQVGGLGVMTFAALAVRIFKGRLGLSYHAALTDSLLQSDAAGEFWKVFWEVLALTMTIELVGALALFAALLPFETVSHAAYSAAFHSVSAFCNAGFSIYSDNIMGFVTYWPVISAIMILIIAGGIGHTVLFELFELVCKVVRREPLSPRLHGEVSFHARVVLLMTPILIVVGTAGLLLLGLVPGEPIGAREFAAALFHSVSARTAGFNSVDLALSPAASLFLLVLLMFIGGSPASCAGGIKTTSFALVLAAIKAFMTGARDVTLLGRRISDEVVRRTLLLVVLALLWNTIGVMLLLVTETAHSGAGMPALVFEQVSAFGTVGLSAGLTPTLSVFGKCWIIATMFFGRLGPLTLATAVILPRRVHVRWPEGRLMIG